MTPFGRYAVGVIDSADVRGLKADDGTIGAGSRGELSQSA
jgi:hypothetical protein